MAVTFSVWTLARARSRKSSSFGKDPHCSRRAAVTITRELLQDLVQENLSKLRDVLESNVPLARQLLSGHLLKLYLQPDPDAGDNSIHVVGGFDLFSGSNAANKGVLLEGSGTPTLQQHAGVLNFVALFDATEKEP